MAKTEAVWNTEQRVLMRTGTDRESAMVAHIENRKMEDKVRKANMNAMIQSLGEGKHSKAMTGTTTSK